jgi:hypothetical protein
MPLRPTRVGFKRLWSHRWFRRITYVLASGAACTGGLVWTVQRPFFNRWIISRLDALSREHTGLGFQAQRLEIHPLEGRIVLEHFAWGDDLFQGERLMVDADLLSLFSGTPRFRAIELENPRILLDRGRLDRIRIKPRPSSEEPSKFQLDRLAVRGGQARVWGEAWGLPDAEFSFRVYGQGTGPNHIQADLRMPRIHLKNGERALDGSLSTLVDLSESTQDIRRGELHLGNSVFRFRGMYEPEGQRVSVRLGGTVDLGESLPFGTSGKAGALEGSTEFNAELEGSVKKPSWKLALQGRDLASPRLGIQPGVLEIKAQGNLRRASLNELHWSSPQGEGRIKGEWQRGKETRIAFQTTGASLRPVASWLRAEVIQPLTVDSSGELILPGDPWSPLRLDAIEGRAEGVFHRTGETAGHFQVRFSKGEATVPELSLEIPEATLEGQGRARFGRRGVLSVSAEGRGSTDAREVAKVLWAWKLPEFYLDMAGSVRSEAQLSWSPAAQFQLRGHAEVESPRWERAQGDHLSTDIRIEGEDLWIENTQILKGEGRGSGDLWLTWRDLEPGEKAIDMCYQAFRLPLEEGMKASGLDVSFTERLGIQGLGSGWVRIHGPYDQLRIEAGGQAENAQVMGIRIPAARGDMDFDLAGDHLSLKDLRLAETPAQLGSEDESPSGDLALHGHLDLDIQRGTWQGGMKGQVDSLPLGLPGPRFQAQTELRLQGPWSVPEAMGLPGANLTFNGGRLFFSQLMDEGSGSYQSVEGLRGSVESGTGGFQAWVAMGDHSEPILALDLWPRGEGVAGALDVHVSPETADTQHLAASLTGDLLVDGRLDLQLDGSWDGRGMRWKGKIENLLGRFDGFDLVQERPADLSGSGSQAALDLDLLVRKTLGLEAQASDRTGTFQLAGSLPFSSRDPLAMRIKGSAELADLKAILDHILRIDPYSLAGYMQPKGTAQFDLTAGGNYLVPTLDGELSLKGGRLLVQTYPQSIEDLDFRVQFKGREILLPEREPLQGRLAQGRLQAWGRGVWDFGGLTDYDFHANLKGFEIRDVPEGLELRGSLDANLRGDGEQGLLKGTIEADRMLYQTEINLRDFILSSSLGSSSFLAQVNPDDPLSRIALDLDVKMKEWEFDTNLLKVQGRPRGSLKIQGSLLEPGFKGVMEIIPGGRITNVLPAGDIILEGGSISFPDSAIASTYLDLNGRIDISPFMVDLKITGPIDQLDMKTSSTPSLRQDEILSILIDPSQATTIGSSAGQVNQGTMSSGLFATSSGLLTTLALAEFQDRLRKLFHLDRVNVVWRAGTAGSSETDITLGLHANLFGLRTPIVYNHKKVGDVITQSQKAEWRLGNFVFQLGFSQSGSDKMGVAGEIRHTWIPRW